ncbi:MAG: hypothetical protein ACP5F3_07200, partial [Candidatus Syntrophosphaera sp.]
MNKGKKTILPDLRDFYNHLRASGRDDSWLDLARAFIPGYYEELKRSEDDPEFVRNYAARNIARSHDSERKLALMLWYHDFFGDREESGYLITLFGTQGVLESQMAKVKKLFGDMVTERMARDIHIPPLGSDLRSYPPMIRAYLKALKASLSAEECRKVLLGNHHGIGTAGFESEKEHFKQSASLEEYLRERHERFVNKLQEHCDTGKMWFEQYITQGVVDYIKGHQEVHTGILDEGRIIVHKIPYAPEAWLKETDPVKKRHLACHCPFARASILEGEPVDKLWCHCSAGFTKVFW